MRDDHPEINIDVYKYTPIKPLYMLIKVDVDKQIVYNQDKAEKYAENHCNSLEYALVDWYYPDNEQYPYIAKWVNNQGSRRTLSSP